MENHPDMPKMIAYFAYGSNMSHERMKSRVPSAEPACSGRLLKHKLAFDKPSTDLSAKANCEPTTDASDVVHGGIYGILEAELPELDKAEGRGKGYERVNVKVETNGGMVSAFTYIATAKDTSRQPYSWYMKHVLQGVRDFGLPFDYALKVGQITAVQDADTEREKRELAIYPKPAWSDVHESVLVGQFCYSVGWLNCISVHQAHEDKAGRIDWIDAVNLSHGPLDPAVGDLISSFSSTSDFPKRFHIFELKVDWAGGIEKEKEKFSTRTMALSKAPLFNESYVKALREAHPKSDKAHWYGALPPSGAPKFRGLGISAYWPTVTNEAVVPIPLLKAILAMRSAEDAYQGFLIDELEAYVNALNVSAGGGTKAADGSKMLVGALKGYDMVLFKPEDLPILFSRYRHVKAKEAAPKFRI